jgi:hypothetical protein
MRDRDKEFYRTPPRPRGARTADTDPRPGEDPARGGQKVYVPDPDGMKTTEPNIKSEGGDEPPEPN